MVNDTTRELLTELADFLDALPEERFDYHTWVGRDWGGRPDLSCGTVACAAGWATTLRSFQDRGLYLSPDYHEPAIIRDSHMGAIEAMAEVLEIDHDDARLLFIPDTYDDSLGLQAPSSTANSHDVALHIRDYLEARA